MAILRDPDEDLYDAEEVIAGDFVAKYVWGSDDSPGSSTNYTSSLIEFRCGLALSYPTGDLLDWVQPSVIVLTDDPQRRAASVIEWLEQMAGASSAAVFSLEPLDPSNTLSVEQRAEWETALDDDRYSLDFLLDQPTKAALRSVLGEDSTYQYIREALADPLGEKGRTVYTELTEGEILTAGY